MEHLLHPKNYVNVSQPKSDIVPTLSLGLVEEPEKQLEINPPVRKRHSVSSPKNFKLHFKKLNNFSKTFSY